MLYIIVVWIGCFIVNVVVWIDYWYKVLFCRVDQVGDFWICVVVFQQVLYVEDYF